MSNKIVTIFLTTLFVLFIAAPTIIVMVDDTIDVSFAFSTSEEEEKGNEKNIDIEMLFYSENTNEIDLVFSSNKNSLGYFFKNYQRPHLNLISPPPERY